MTDMADMTKAEVLAIWKGFVRNMTDQGAVFPFANEIASRVRNELLDRLEAAEKERDTLRAKIAEMEKQEPVAQVGVHKTGGNAGIAWSARPLNEFDSLPLLCDGDKLYLATGAQPAPSVPAVDALAQFIREIDGAHRLGAGVLAERIVAWLAAAPEAK